MLHAHEPTIRITTYEVGIIIMLVDVGRTRQPGVRGLAQGPPDEWGHLNLATKSPLIPGCSPPWSLTLYSFYSRDSRRPAERKNPVFPRASLIIRMARGTHSTRYLYPLQ